MTPRLPSPKAFNIILTSRCNFSCAYCEFDCGRTGKDLPIHLLEKLLVQGRELGVEKVFYDGGEPLLYHRLEQLLELTRQHGYETTMITNAWHVPDKIDLLRKYDVKDFMIGLDGADAATHDSIRGKKGSFARVIQSLELLDSLGIPKSLHLVVQPKNFSQVGGIIELAAKHDCGIILISPLNTHLGGAKRNGILPITPEQEESVISQIRDRRSNNKVRIVTEYLNEDRQLNCKYLSFDQLSVDWNGKVLLCALQAGTSLPFPSLQDNTLQEAFDKVKEMNRIFMEYKDTEFAEWKAGNRHPLCVYCLQQVEKKPRIVLDPAERSAYKKFDGDLLLTTACPTECEFCVYSCGPDGEWMPEKTIRRIAEEYTKNDIGIRIGGGEPFYDLTRLERCLDIVLEHQKPHEILVITSGFFGGSNKTRRALKMLSDRKLDTLVVSVDRFHLKSIGLSNIINIIEEARKLSLKIILRFTTDEQSYDLMDKVAEIVVRYGIKVEPHHQYGVYGKAELLDPRLRENEKQREEHFRKKLVAYANKFCKPAIVGEYETQSPKRSQRKFAGRFHATTFPNGNVYADTQCTKGAYMGNILKHDLKELIDRFSQTLPGKVLWSEKSDCSRIRALMPDGATDPCDYCRTHPLNTEIPDEANGRDYILIDPHDDLNSIAERLKGLNRKPIIAFSLLEKDLSYNHKIIAFLKQLKSDGIRFRLSRPIPRCVVGTYYHTLVREHGMPTDCTQCHELFTYDNGFVSCKAIGAKLQNADSRGQLLDAFNGKRLQSALCRTCQSCVHNARGQCDGLCHRLTDVPQEVKIEVTAKCNMDCSFCYNQNSYSRSVEDMPTNRIFQIIDDIAESGVQRVRFSGGEPLLRNDLIDLLKYAKSRGLHVTVNTNSMMMDDVSRFSGLVDLFMISFNSLDDFSSKKKTKQDLKDFNVLMNTVMTRENIRDLEKFAEAVYYMGVEWFLLRPVPNAENKMPMSVDNVKLLIEKLLKLKDKYGTIAVDDIPFCAYDPEKVRQFSRGAQECGIYNQLVVDPTGKIKPCYSINEDIGKGIAEAWNHQLPRKIRQLQMLPRECKECRYVNDCLGGCRFAAWLVNGSYDSLDPMAMPGKWLTAQ